MVRASIFGLAAVLAVLASPAASETRVLSAVSQTIAGGPSFKMVNGIPGELQRNGSAVVGDGSLPRNTIYVFAEAQGATLTDTLRPGRGPSIPAGTRVDSFYVCVDTAVAPSDPGPRNGARYAGYIHFDNADLLAVVLRPTQLAASAKAVGKPGIAYGSSRFVGVDPFWMGQDDQTFVGGEFSFYGDANGIDCRRLIFRAKP